MIVKLPSHNEKREQGILPITNTEKLFAIIDAIWVNCKLYIP